MKALCYNNVRDLRVENIPDPAIISPKDMIIRVTLSSVCGSDLHIINGFIPTVKSGDVLGHEFMGEVVETGSEVRKFVKGDRVVVSSVIACGECHYCQHDSFSLCDNTNPNAFMPEKLYGDTMAGIFGYTHAFGGYAGSHAQYIRIPFADIGAFKVPEGLHDDSVIFCSDAFPTGYMAADMADIKPGSVVAIWGCGGVGQMAIQSAWLMGAERVIAIDKEPYRLRMAREKGRAETINFEEADVLEALRDMTAGRGPDCCIDAVGMEASGSGFGYAYDKVKQWAKLENDRPLVLRDAIMACRKGGNVSIVGVYSGFVDKIPMGAAMNKGLTFKMGQMHGQKYIPQLLEYVQSGQVDPSFMVTHKMGLEQGQEGYDMFTQKTDNCMRVVFAP
ncbi:zinc-dependent alcohol dehydrogenase [Dyadobacter sediminis]|uniref:Glutathione-dependent formaldehyde dehydrogenase n=1 Tax=Dyadobacter sediminis TaxID=1493691 RepID=A0A5R9KIU4_9BACT|nr:zinc-dependent alcohol dehydrogenase [Dyadobacter sediminis]TLU96143.1 glutathione-dependent formaldehyde dehydrogenase [Dyadobacter sediminis]GGB79651.1 glutathione-dependent formaldehyde dehydrogenase [Dyadobacter sediminis]